MRGVTIDDLSSCVNNAVSALSLLTGAGPDTGQRRLFQMLCRHLEREIPRAWLDLFKSSRTIAMFIKYINREDFNKTYEKFESINDGNTEFYTVLQLVRKTYWQPLVFPQEVNDMIECTNAVAAKDELLRKVGSRAVGQMDEDYKFIIDVSLVWIQRIGDSYGST